MKIKNIIKSIVIIMLMLMATKRITICASETINEINKIASIIPQEATIFVEQNYKDILEVSYSYYDHIISDNWNDYLLGKPYVIYDPDALIWDEVYYYPVLYENEVVLIISAINTTEGWTLSAANDMVDDLKNINYDGNFSVVFCELNNDIVLVSDKLSVIRENNGKGYSKKEKAFRESSYTEKISKVISAMNDMKPVNITQVQDMTQTNEIKMEAYEPSFSEDRNSGSDYVKTCALYNRQGQGEDKICWAAVVATIVNYRLGENYTAKDICDKAGTGYVGVNLLTAKRVLENYISNWYMKTTSLSWEIITKNISKKYPIFGSTTSTGTIGHAITVYGYKFTNANKYIVLHNPGTNDTQIVLYKTDGSTFTYNNKAWIWTGSIYFYTNN